jgi:hypothetical protein
MTEFVSPFEYSYERVWPYDGRYLCKCMNCKERYAGPKKSGMCWLCVSEDIKQWWHERNKDNVNCQKL